MWDVPTWGTPSPPPPLLSAMKDGFFLRMMGRRNDKEWALLWTSGLSVLHLVINSHSPL